MSLENSSNKIFRGSIYTVLGFKNRKCFEDTVSKPLRKEVWNKFVDCFKSEMANPANLLIVTNIVSSIAQKDPNSNFYKVSDIISYKPQDASKREKAIRESTDILQSMNLEIVFNELAEIKKEAESILNSPLNLPGGGGLPNKELFEQTRQYIDGLEKLFKARKEEVVRSIVSGRADLLGKKYCESPAKREDAMLILLDDELRKFYDITVKEKGLDSMVSYKECKRLYEETKHERSQSNVTIAALEPVEISVNKVVVQPLANESSKECEKNRTRRTETGAGHRQEQGSHIREILGEKIAKLEGRKTVAKEEKSGMLDRTVSLVQNFISHDLRDGKMDTDVKQQTESLHEKTHQSPQSTEGRLDVVQAQLEQEKPELQGKLNERKEELDKMVVGVEELNKTNTGLEEKINNLTDQVDNLNREKSSLDSQLEEKKKELDNVNEKLAQEQLKASQLGDQVTKLTREVDETKSRLKNDEIELKQAKQDASMLEDKVSQSDRQNSQLQGKLDNTQQSLDEKIGELSRINEENIKLQSELKLKKHENNDLKTKLQESTTKSKGQEGRVEDLQKQLQSKNEELNGKNKELSSISAQSRKHIAYASVSFVLSGAFAVSASLTMSYLAICISLAVAALVSLVAGCYCSCKASTALSNVEEIENCISHTASRTQVT